METTDDLVVREMTLDEVHIRIDYFHNSSDAYLERLGVDRSLLPPPDEWFSFYEVDADRPIEARIFYSLLWLVRDEPVGFGSLDRIEFGNQAFMHLHVIDEDDRRRGLGTECVRRSVAIYFETFGLRRLFCEPNALNVAPNRTVQAAGFRYLFSHFTTPGPINVAQVTTRWVIERPVTRHVA